jgi:uncharacterized protein (DUF305 family)
MDHSMHDHNHEDMGGNKLSDYLPLAIIFVFISALTMLFANTSKDFSLMALLSYFMGSFFVIFSLFKLLDLKGFAEGYSTYDLIAKKFKAYAYIYPFIELFLGVLFLLKIDSIVLNVFTLAVTLVSSLGVAQSILRKQKVYCVCLGNILKVPLSTVSLFENLLMSLMSILMIGMLATMQSTQATINSTLNTVDHSMHLAMGHANITSEEQFLFEMIPHHQEAVDTSKYLADRTQNSELILFTDMVIKDQSKEIEDMKNWYRSWYGKEYVVNTNYRPMMGDLTKSEGTTLDKLWITGMIVHHEGAVMMAQQVLNVQIKPETKTLAENIIKNQTIEINYLKGLLLRIQ